MMNFKGDHGDFDHFGKLKASSWPSYRLIYHVFMISNHENMIYQPIQRLFSSLPFYR